ncbi:MAG: DUF4129 domain-containing protein [Candidatus Sumerlaeia bacterium]|nr:DUF4129 domain-containing protein [Candidatus Sumerlaeia bacterium]
MRPDIKIGGTSFSVFILYILCFLLGNFSIGFALHYSLPQIGPVYFYILTPIYLFLFILVIIYRPLLLDLTASLQYRERLGIFFIHLAFFALPQTYLRQSNVIVGLSVLNLPLIFFLLRPHNFCLFYLNNILIFLLGLFYSSRLPILAFWLFNNILLITFIIDNIAFKLEKYVTSLEKIDWTVFSKPALWGMLFVSISTFLLNLFTPELVPRQLYILKSSAISTHSAPPLKPLDEKTILELAFSLFLLIISVFVLLAMLNWINKKLRRRPKHSALLKPSSTIAHFKKILRDTFARSFRISLADPRSAIIYYYNALCEEMAHLDLKREPYTTPKDYEAILRKQFYPLAEVLGYLRRTFELAKYSTATLTEKDAQSYQQTSEFFIQKAKEILSQRKTSTTNS